MEFPHFQHEVMDEHPGDASCIPKPGLDPRQLARLVFIVIIIINNNYFIIIIVIISSSTVGF